MAAPEWQQNPTNLLIHCATGSLRESVAKQRLKNERGGYDCYILSFKVVLCDAIGKPWLLLLQSVRCQVVPPENTNFYRIISMKPVDLFKKYRLLDKDDYCMLTNTEKKIACEVNSEKSCVEIANYLFNSPTTIYKHFPISIERWA